MIVLHGEAFRGKTQTAVQVARAIERSEFELWGEWVEQYERIPVVYISLDAAQIPSPKQLLREIARFLGISGWTNGTGDYLLAMVYRWVVQHDVQLIVIDELHFANRTQSAGRQMSDFLKSMQDTLPVTLLLVGIDLETFVRELNADHRAAQMPERAVEFRLGDIETATVKQRQSWFQFLLGAETRLLLAAIEPRWLATNMCLWLLGRSGARIGTVMNLIHGAAHAAMRSNRETLIVEDFERVPLSAAVQPRRRHHLEVLTSPADVDTWVRTGKLPPSADLRLRHG